MTRPQSYQRALDQTAFASALASFHCARPGDVAGQRRREERKTQHGSGLKSWQRAARFRRTLVCPLEISSARNERSSLERGSAATRTVVRSISLVFGPDELTHISRINRR